MCQCFLERAQHYVVGHIVRVCHCFYRVYEYGVHPSGILPRGRFARRYDNVFGKSDVFAFLFEYEVVFRVVESVYPVFARRQSFYHEFSAAVGAADVFERCGGECRVFKVGVQAYEDSFYRFEVGGVEHFARHFHGVDVFSCREYERIAFHRVAFVVVFDSVGEVDCVCRVCPQRVAQFDKYLASRGAYFGLFELWGRDYHFFGSVVEAYVFVEHERDALLDVVYRVFGRCGAYYYRRGFVVGAAVGTSGVCT